MSEFECGLIRKTKGFRNPGNSTLRCSCGSAESSRDLAALQNTGGAALPWGGAVLSPPSVLLRNDGREGNAVWHSYDSPGRAALA